MLNAEVCNILDISETNQRVLLHRGRTRVRRMWQRVQYWLHLAMCAACRRYVAQMQLTTKMIRRLGDRPGSPGTIDPALREAFRKHHDTHPGP